LSQPIPIFAAAAEAIGNGVADPSCALAAVAVKDGAAIVATVIIS
jgi:hypothetical protein